MAFLNTLHRMKESLLTIEELKLEATIKEVLTGSHKKLQNPQINTPSIRIWSLTSTIPFQSQLRERIPTLHMPLVSQL
jgi:hypothetical protein